MNSAPRFIDLFAGAGGLSEGFIRAGFVPIAHVEMDEAACYTLKTRAAYHHLLSAGKVEVYIKYLRGEIGRETLYSCVPKKELDRVINLPLGDRNNREIFRRIDKLNSESVVDVIIGGPPCQAYSLVGRARSQNGMKDDPRNYLFLQYAKYLKRYNPKLFVFENVLGLRSAGDGEYFRTMKDRFNSVGYGVEDLLINARDCGVLQNRKRIVLIGYKKGTTAPKLVLRQRHKSGTTVASLLQDLPRLFAGEGLDKNGKYKGGTNSYLAASHIRNGISVLTQHVTRPHTEQDKEIYKIAISQLKEGVRLSYDALPSRLKSHRNQHSFFDRFKVVDDQSMSAQTVVAHIAKDGHYYIHPDSSQNRSLSVREAARLQSFPDDFYFEGVKEGRNRTAAFKQIGNAVPPLMAEQIALSLKEFLK